MFTTRFWAFGLYSNSGLAHCNSSFCMRLTLQRLKGKPNMSTLFSFSSTEEVKWLSHHSPISSGAYLSAVALYASQGFQLVRACNTNTIRHSINRLTFTSLYLVCCVLIHLHRSVCQSYAEKPSSRQDLNRLRQEVAILIIHWSQLTHLHSTQAHIFHVLVLWVNIFNCFVKLMITRSI